MLGLSCVPLTTWLESLSSCLRGQSTAETDNGDRHAFRDLPRAARLWVIVMAIAYVWTAVWAAPHARLIVLTVLVSVFALAALVKPLPHPGGGIQAANSGISVTAALIWAPPDVLLGIGIGSVIGARVFRRAGWSRATGNPASWGLAGGAAAAVAQSLMPVLPYGILRIVGGLLAAALTHFLSNRAMWSFFRSRRFQRPFFREWLQSLSFSWPQELLRLPIVFGVVTLAYSLNDVAWSLAITTATTLLVPLEYEIDRFSLDVIMRMRATVAPVKARVPAFEQLADGSSGGGIKGTCNQYGRAVNSQAAALLWPNETRFRALAEHLSDGIALINAEGTILYLSPSALQILGHENFAHVGRSWFEMHHPEDSERLKASFSSVVRSPGSHFTDETRMLHRDGSWRWVHTVHTNLLMEPSVQTMVVTYRDITQVRRSEETLEEYAARLEDLSRRLVQTQEMERRKIAQELHDETGQILTGLKLMVDVVFKQVGESEAKATLARAAAMLETLNKHVRTLSLNLRPPALDDLGLLPAVLLLCNQYAAQTSVEVNVTHTGISGRRFAAEIETTAYRIIQESLTNVARHASAVGATIRLWTDEEILGIQVEDGGKGFDIEALKAVDQSRGISGMRERASLVGGQFSIESTPGVGTRLTAELPFRRARIGAITATHGS